MLTVYRTVKAAYRDEPLSAEGARRYGGRWNPKGYAVLYTTSSPALALIESLVHQPRVLYQKLPPLFLITLEVPVSTSSDDVLYFPPEALPDYWNEGSYERTQWLLRDWLEQPTTLVAAVPSVAVPMSFNYLLHPAHPQFSAINVVKREPFPIERRLWPEGNAT